MEIPDYAKSLSIIMEGSGWVMYINDKDELVSEASARSDVREEDLE